MGRRPPGQSPSQFPCDQSLGLHLESLPPSAHRIEVVQIGLHRGQHRHAPRTRRRDTSYRERHWSAHPMKTHEPPGARHGLRQMADLNLVSDSSRQCPEDRLDDPLPPCRPVGATSRDDYRRLGATRVLCDLPSGESRRPRDTPLLSSLIHTTPNVIRRQSCRRSRQDQLLGQLPNAANDHPMQP